MYVRYVLNKYKKALKQYTKNHLIDHKILYKKTICADLLDCAMCIGIGRYRYLVVSIGIRMPIPKRYILHTQYEVSTQQSGIRSKICVVRAGVKGLFTQHNTHEKEVRHKIQMAVRHLVVPKQPLLRPSPNSSKARNLFGLGH